MDKNTAFLLREGYKRAQLHDSGTMAGSEISPDSVVVFDDAHSATEYCVTSTRITLYGRELGSPNDDWGIVCAKDIRGSSNFENTLPGGRVEPFMNEFRSEGDGEADESVVSCLLRETEEEVGIVLVPTEVILVALRTITEEDSATLKTIGGKVCVDAYFVGFVEKKLGTHRARNGETGDRRVLSPEELLRRTERGEKKQLPQTQRLALATANLSMWEIFGNSIPEPIM